MEWISRPTFKRQHPELADLPGEWKKFKKEQEQSLYNKYHGLNGCSDLNKVTGFRSKKKNEYLNIEPEHRKLVPDGFDLDKSKKNYMCHLFYPNGTYFADIMFTGNLKYLVLMDFHSRMIYVKLLDGKMTNKLAQVFWQIMQENKLKGKIKYLRADGEKGFEAHQFQNNLRSWNIKFYPVKRFELYPKFRQSNHDKLGVINRVMRTLRDQAYVIGVGDPIPEEVMNHLVKMYNNAPHSFLSKFYGDYISPAQVDEEKKLEIWRRVQQHNFNVSKRRGFYIKPGSEVAVYNDDFTHKRRQQVRPVRYKVLGYHNGGYDLMDEFGKEFNVSRFRMKLLPKD